MKAVFYEKFTQPPTVQTLPDPTPTDRGVVIQVKATGLCRSDWHGWQGHDPDITPPHVPGHEFAGVIEAVGRAVSRWRPGDRVTLPFVCGCGACPQVCVGQPPGLRSPIPARLHPLGLLCRIRRHRLRRCQPGALTRGYGL